MQAGIIPLLVTACDPRPRSFVDVHKAQRALCALVSATTSPQHVRIAVECGVFPAILPILKRKNTSLQIKLLRSIHKLLTDAMAEEVPEQAVKPIPGKRPKLESTWYEYIKSEALVNGFLWLDECCRSWHSGVARLAKRIRKTHFASQHDDDEDEPDFEDS